MLSRWVFGSVQFQKRNFEVADEWYGLRIGKQKTWNKVRRTRIDNHFNTIYLARMSTDCFMGFAQGLTVVWRLFSDEHISEKRRTTTSVAFESQTSVVRLWRIKHWATQSSLTGIWGPDLFFSFIKDKPLGYLVNGDWVVLWNITNTSVKATYLFAVEHTHTKSKPISIQTLKRSHFRPQDTNQINSDP